eukprot:TRINITY_DN42621_c1_g1_i1.p1 TRINITY_DN42621_c1_g1~~TRINITY_DN42621_c1_g1_i1.p1  ORF type:complete len:877 (-),score=179.12 TRINITY_DN42621_c1_g1_i1:162-2792(-)
MLAALGLTSSRAAGQQERGRRRSRLRKWFRSMTTSRSCSPTVSSTRAGGSSSSAISSLTIASAELQPSDSSDSSGSDFYSEPRRPRRAATRAGAQRPVAVRNLETGEVRELCTADADIRQQLFPDTPQVSEESVPASEAQRLSNELLWKAAASGTVEAFLASISESPLCPLRGQPAKAAGGDPDSAAGLADLEADADVHGAAAEEAGAAASSSLPPTSLEVAPELESRSLQGRTALHIAAAAGHAGSVGALLAAGASIDCRTPLGETPLHLACRHGQPAAVQTLLALKCDIGSQTNQGDLAFHVAAGQGQAEVLKVLLQSQSIEKSKELLRVRNCLGQRPAEVVTSVGAAIILREFLIQTSREEQATTPSDEADSYAARSVHYWPGGASNVLRNSRADAVRCLLGRSHHAVPESSAPPAYRSPLKSRPRRCMVSVPEPADMRSAWSSTSSPSMSSSGARPSRPRPRSVSKLMADTVEEVGSESFTMKSMLGKGAFGEVYEAQYKGTGQTYAMKVLRKQRIFGKQLVNYAVTERNLLSYIRHPFIVRLHFAFQTPSLLVLVLEYCPGGNLSSLLKREERLYDNLARVYMGEIFLAIEHLHERNVVYRDLKPENVVLDSERHAMLTDFGLSKEGVHGPKGTKSFCGSVAYLAPEVLLRVGHGPQVDLYGLGVLLFELLTGSPPYYNRERQKLFRNIQSAQLQVPSYVSVVAGALIYALMQRDPSKRLGAARTSDVRQHPYFTSINFGKLLRREIPVPPCRTSRSAKSNAAMPKTSGTSSKEASGQKLQSPFEGRLETQLRRLTWSTQQLAGWEFSTPTQLSTPNPSRTSSLPPLPDMDAEKLGSSKPSGDQDFSPVFEQSPGKVSRNDLHRIARPLRQ